MRQMIQKRQTENTPARRVGNSLMIAGVATPIIGIAITKVVTLEFANYRRVIPAIFIAGLVLFVGGILVKNYWKGSKADERYDPSGLWSNANRVAQKRQFDWTGIGCSLLVLGPGIFFIVGILLGRAFDYAPVVGFVCVVLFTIVGSKLYNLGKARRAQELSEERVANALRANAGVTGSERPADENLSEITPLTTPEGFVLVDDSKAVTCGIGFLGIFTAIWYGATFFFMFMVSRFGGEDAGKGMLFLLIFLLAGLMPLFFLIRLVRMGRAFEKRAELLLPHWPLQSGDEVEMSFQCNLKKALTAMSVHATLECQKVDRGGSETQTTTVDTRSQSVRDFKQQDKRITGKWLMGMPTTWTLPYKRETEDLGWKVNVVVELAEGPKGIFNFPLLVLPKREVEDNDANSKTKVGPVSATIG